MCACGRAGARGFTWAGTTGFAPFPSLGCRAQPAPPTPCTSCWGEITIKNARDHAGSAVRSGRYWQLRLGSTSVSVRRSSLAAPAVVVSRGPRRGHGRADVVWASSPRALLPSQNGSQAGVPSRQRHPARDTSSPFLAHSPVPTRGMWGCGSEPTGPSPTLAPPVPPTVPEQAGPAGSVPLPCAVT